MKLNILAFALMVSGCSGDSLDTLHAPNVLKIGECLDVVIETIEVPATWDTCAVAMGTKVLYLEQDSCEDGPRCIVIYPGEGAQMLRPIDQPGWSLYRWDACADLECNAELERNGKL